MRSDIGKSQTEIAANLRELAYDDGSKVFRQVFAGALYVIGENDFPCALVSVINPDFVNVKCLLLLTEDPRQVEQQLMSIGDILFIRWQIRARAALELYHGNQYRTLRFSVPIGWFIETSRG